MFDACLGNSFLADLQEFYTIKKKHNKPFYGTSLFRYQLACLKRAAAPLVIGKDPLPLDPGL